MPYNKTSWQNNITPINENNLNNIENGVDTAFTHTETAHAPSDAENNASILKTEVENVLTGVILTHSHPNETRYGTADTPPSVGWNSGSPQAGDIWIQHS